MPIVATSISAGLSPRVRGSHGWSGGLDQCYGSIPACAGEPEYPDGSYDEAAGLSPRVRGSRPRHLRAGGEQGSIPACAGEPSSRRAGLRQARVYPRVCGGAVPSGWTAQTETGLSPRVRGSLVHHGEHGSPIGSIPACAGEPCQDGGC